MAVNPVLNSEALSSQERWLRWEQRGRAHDERFMRRVRHLFWSTFVVATAVLILTLTLY